MQDIHSILNSLRRPRLLMRAARIGADSYRRSVHLPRHLGYGPLPRQGAAIMRLLEIESDLNMQRQDKDAGYSLLRHVDIMIAIVGEARIMRSTQLQAVE